MAGEKQDGGASTPATSDESGAGYGNNPIADEVGEAGEDEETMPNAADD